LAVAAIGLLTLPATGAEVHLKDGRVLTGHLGMVTTLGEVVKGESADGSGPLQLVVLLDDDLRRIFIPKFQVREIKQEDPEARERFLIRQRTPSGGKRVTAVSPFLAIQPFDEFGRRVLTMTTGKGPLDVIQGITELTPDWTKVQGVEYVWDMRIATSSIPPDILHKLLYHQIDPKNIEHRKRVAKFYIQCERYRDAARELQQVLAEFPDDATKEQIQPTLDALRQMEARQRLAELKVRQDAGQYEFVADLLKIFPTQNVAGEILQSIREMIDGLTAIQSRRKEVLAKIDELLPQIADTSLRDRLKPLRDEVAAELGPSTLRRMASFMQSLDDPAMIPADKLALAFSGWLLGADAASLKLPGAVSAYQVRELIRRYLNEPVKLNRGRCLSEMASIETGTPAPVALLLANMKPPIVTPPGDPQHPGYFELEVPGRPNEAASRYYVQLPPEYDPYRRYPTIVTLNGAGTTAAQQVDWWAGDWIAPAPPSANATPQEREAAQQAPQRRAGQATRFGYIVIAPDWTVEHQREYHYTAREHTAVLSCLRDACRRFAVDTDRVFLSGHSMGGDAAWDIGLAHPDLWAGVIPIVARCDKYGSLYWQNAKLLPLYFIAGELDGSRMVKNIPEYDRYVKANYNVTVVEFEGRGHEPFSDEIQRLFDWMGRFHRDFFPREFACYTMRQWDNYFWWVELVGMPPRSMVDPSDWPPPRGTLPARVEAGRAGNNTLHVKVASAAVNIWLAPPLVDFQHRLNITVNGNRIANGGSPSLDVMLEDVRTRGDRQHPFWARLETSAGRVFGDR
jgi:predicted esterase